MRTIHKYALEVTDRQTVSLPQGARILTAQLHEGQLVMWAEVDDLSDDREERTVRIFGTGNPIAHGFTLDYIASVQMRPYVWHIYEDGRK